MKKVLTLALLLVAGFALGWTLADGAYRNPAWWMRVLLLTLLMIVIIVIVKRRRMRTAESKLKQEVQDGV